MKQVMLTLLSILSATERGIKDKAGLDIFGITRTMVLEKHILDGQILRDLQIKIVLSGVQSSSDH